VFNQTFVDWEAICVDDGSTDGSSAILDEYAARDKRFRVFHQANAGVSMARNSGLDNAKGEWICFLDGDDVWNCYLLQYIREAITKFPKDVLFRFSNEKFDSGVVWSKLDVKCECDFQVIEISQKISMHDFARYLFGCYVYRRNSIDGIRFPRYIRGEDRCFVNKVQLERAQRIVATNVPLYGYRTRPGSAVNSIPSLQVLCDEMDHRLDIMEMIDKSQKQVDYKGNYWLEKYFTEVFYAIIFERKDRNECVLNWYTRLLRLYKVKGLSKYGYCVSWICARVRLRLVDALFCSVVPRLIIRCSPIRYIRKKS
jgi:glycosyltransferase involved in cell wall biosynthesis